MFLGCKKWPEPEFKADEWVPPLNASFWTIMSPTGDLGVSARNVLGKHWDKDAAKWKTQPDSIAELNEAPRYIRAVVVSSDEGGNYYKSMVIQDHTAGVELELDMTGLYNIYPVGQKIVLVANGLVVGNYNNLPQVGWIYNKNQVGRINSLYFNKYIIKDGLPNPKNLPKALTNDEINFSGGYRDINKLVCLKNVTFQNEAIGQPLAYNDFITDWIINVPLASGKKQPVTVRTSNFAKFRSMIIEKKEYELTGILTIYKNTYQLMIRTKEDIKVSSEGAIIIDFSSNPMNWEEKERWSNHSLQNPNNPWNFRTNAMAHIGNQSHIPMDDWLISPVFNHPNTANGYLHFEHQIDVKNGHEIPYKVYYTISTANVFNLEDWKELGVLNSFPATYEWSNRFPLSAIKSKTFRIAFRYNATNTDVDTYIWNIRKIEIR